jgi:hypothetical protein
VWFGLGFLARAQGRRASARARKTGGRRTGERGKEWGAATPSGEAEYVLFASRSNVLTQGLGRSCAERVQKVICSMLHFGTLNSGRVVSSYVPCFFTNTATWIDFHPRTSPNLGRPTQPRSLGNMRPIDLVFDRASVPPALSGSHRWKHLSSRYRGRTRGTPLGCGWPQNHVPLLDQRCH